ncbi:MAG: c-type heme family protein [Thermodesulfobacteriota bacterium]
MNTSKNSLPASAGKKTFRIALYFLVAVLAANFAALIDLILHPHLPYFDRQHFIAGGISILVIITLCVAVENCIGRRSSGDGPLSSPRLGPYVCFAVAFWTVILAVSLGWNIVRQKQEIMQVATNEARTIFEKDMIYYRWATRTEGVFVPITQNTQPNPYLADIPGTEGITSLNTPLTLVNPEYMIRQVYEMHSPSSGVLGHITSLDPIRSENAADLWETAALNAFEEGATEISSVEEINGKPYLRLMRPLITETGCLKCHAQQGYETEDIRGGISVSVPMSLLFDIYYRDVFMFSLAHAILWSLGMLGIFFGSSRINHAMREREQAEARTRSIIDNMLDGLITMDQSGRIESVNSACCAMFGYDDAGELVGRSIDALIEFPFVPNWDAGRKDEKEFDIRKAMGSQQELTGRKKDHSAFPLEISLSEMQHGPSALLIATVRDITEEKIRKAEAVRTGQLAAIGELAAGVAHEINNPINGIINYTQILLDDTEAGDEGSAGQRDIMARIIKEGERIAGIVGNLLSFARQRDEIVERIVIKDVIQDSLALLMHQLQKDGIHLTVNVPAELPFLKGNPQQLQQVFVNLLTNAVYALNQKHQGKDPEKRLEIESGVIELEGRQFIRTEVRDWGAGIPAEVISHIFDTLFTTKPPGQGTGLGLNISKGLVRDHNGFLSLKSTPDGPTVATVDLPVAEAAPTA